MNLHLNLLRHGMVCLPLLLMMVPVFVATPVGNMKLYSFPHFHAPLPAAAAGRVVRYPKESLLHNAEQKQGLRSLLSAPSNQTCTPCLPGSYSSTFRESCIPCPLGSAQPNPASDACEPCSKGFFSGTQMGSERCSKCSAGKFSGQSPYVTSILVQNSNPGHTMMIPLIATITYNL